MAFAIRLGLVVLMYWSTSLLELILEAVERGQKLGEWISGAITACQGPWNIIPYYTDSISYPWRISPVALFNVNLSPTFIYDLLNKVIQSNEWK